MSNIVSANALFHYTKSIDTIENIISNGFSPKYCLEYLDFTYNLNDENSFPTKIAVPMVCFCDIPLSQINTHKSNYGGYALGLSKEWGERKGVNPVLYELPNSNAINIIKTCLNSAFQPSSSNNKENTKTRNKINEIRSEILSFVCYIKPYEGKSWDGSGFNGNKIKFYDEREWRYIPNYDLIREKSLMPYMYAEDFLDSSKREVFNNYMENDFKLEFGPNDVKYIIVDTENDVLTMLNKISELNLDCTDNEKKLLYTKIISFEKIQQDF